jgi:hypothetical protein
VFLDFYIDDVERDVPPLDMRRDPPFDVAATPR